MPEFYLDCPGWHRLGQQAFWYETLSDGLATQQYGSYGFTPLTAQPEITSHLAGARDNPDTPDLNPQVGNRTSTRSRSRSKTRPCGRADPPGAGLPVPLGE